VPNVHIGDLRAHRDHHLDGAFQVLAMRTLRCLLMLSAVFLSAGSRGEADRRSPTSEAQRIALNFGSVLVAGRLADAAHSMVLPNDLSTKQIANERRDAASALSTLLSVMGALEDVRVATDPTAAYLVAIGGGA
jgi:hypothetical protein